MDHSVINNPVAPDREEEAGVDVRRYLAVVLKHKWSILGLSLIHI